MPPPTPPTYSSAQLAEGRALVSALSPQDNKLLVVGEDHRYGHGRGLTAELIKRGRVTQVCLELPHNLHPLSHLPPGTSREEAAFLDRVNAVHLARSTGKSASAASSSSTSSSSPRDPSLDDYAGFFRTLNNRLASEPSIRLDQEARWPEISGYIDLHFRVGNPVPFSRLIEFSYRNGCRVTLIDDEYQQSGRASRSTKMIDHLQALDDRSQALLLVGSAHLADFQKSRRLPDATTTYATAMEPELDNPFRGSADDSDDD